MWSEMNQQKGVRVPFPGGGEVPHKSHQRWGKAEESGVGHYFFDKVSRKAGGVRRCTSQQVGGCEKSKRRVARRGN